MDTQYGALDVAGNTKVVSAETCKRVFLNLNSIFLYGCYILKVIITKLFIIFRLVLNICKMVLFAYIIVTASSNLNILLCSTLHADF